MKRDIDLIRNILEKIEECESPVDSDKINIEGYSKNNISYHLRLLIEAQYIRGTDIGSPREIWIGIELTWEGHELLDSIRDQRVWERIKETLKTKGIEVPLNILKMMGINYIKQLLGQS